MQQRARTVRVTGDEDRQVADLQRVRIEFRQAAIVQRNAEPVQPEPVDEEPLERLNQQGGGFVIAQKDLELRGPGEVLGTRQTGMMAFQIADLVRDEHLLEPVEHTAERLLADFPTHVDPLIRRWLGHADRYGEV